MSPTAAATVVDVVGADTPNVSSSDSGIGAARRMAEGLFARRGQVDAGPGWPVSAIMVMSLGRWVERVRSSGVVPEKVMKRTVSFCDGTRGVG
jgi:hypothetical protein